MLKILFDIRSVSIKGSFLPKALLLSLALLGCSKSDGRADVTYMELRDYNSLLCGDTLHFSDCAGSHITSVERLKKFAASRGMPLDDNLTSYILAKIKVWHPSDVCVLGGPSNFNPDSVGSRCRCPDFLGPCGFIITRRVSLDFDEFTVKGAVAVGMRPWLGPDGAAVDEAGSGYLDFVLVDGLVSAYPETKRLVFVRMRRQQGDWTVFSVFCAHMVGAVELEKEQASWDRLRAECPIDF
jgi:hypothetical protein